MLSLRYGSVRLASAYLAARAPHNNRALRHGACLRLQRAVNCIDAAFQSHECRTPLTGVYHAPAFHNNARRSSFHAGVPHGVTVNAFAAAATAATPAEPAPGTLNHMDISSYVSRPFQFGAANRFSVQSALFGDL